MSSDFAKVKPGDRMVIPANAYNSFIDAAIDYRSRRDIPTAGTSEGGQHIVRVRNDSGVAIKQGGVLGIDGIVYDPDLAKPATILEPVYVGVVPIVPTHRGRFMIALSPIAIGEVGTAIIEGVAIAKVAFGGTTDTPLTADISDGITASLASCVGGSATILTPSPSTGTVLMPVRLGGYRGAVFPAKITDGSSYAHAWEELEFDGTSFGTLTGGRSGTTSTDAAYELNARKEVPTGTKVLMHESAAGYWFDLSAGVYNAPKDLSYSGEHAADAETTVWDINNQDANKTGVKITMCTGIRYDEASPGLYGYFRNFTFDSNGNLQSFTAETKTLIDATEECSS